MGIKNGMRMVKFGLEGIVKMVNSLGMENIIPHHQLDFI